MPAAARLSLVFASILLSSALPAQEGAAGRARLFCPEYAEPVWAAHGLPEPALLPGRETFRLTFEQETAQGARLAEAVDDLLADAWDAGSIQPRDMLNDLVRAMITDVHGIRNRVEGEPWKERVTAQQVVRVQQLHDRLREVHRGTLAPDELLREFRSLSLRVLLACPASLRDHRVHVPGSVFWERSEHPPHEVTTLYLEDGGLRVRVEWAGAGPVADINPPLFSQMGGAFSHWNVSVSDANGAPVIRLHDFLGLRGLDGSSADSVTIDSVATDSVMIDSVTTDPVTTDPVTTISPHTAGLRQWPGHSFRYEGRPLGIAGTHALTSDELAAYKAGTLDLAEFGGRLGQADQASGRYERKPGL